MTKKSKKLVLKVIKRLSFFSIILVAIVMVLISLMPTQAKSSTGTYYRVVFVREGETLWKIAQKHGGDGDIRELIHQIKKLNKLEYSVIYPGQRLIVPAGE
ncbi:MAG: LysM peptidoglycan-binding domain-containing protein [Carboxydocellales bacterium]